MSKVDTAHNGLIIKKAIDKFNKKLYSDALELFIEAEKIYGKKIVETNIALCKKALSTQESDISQLDDATIIMLSREQRLHLTNDKIAYHLERYKQLVSKKSENAEIKEVRTIPSDWPKDLVLAPLPDSTNDYQWSYSRGNRRNKYTNVSLSVIIPTFNRSKILDITLACLVNQDTEFLFEVIVADDGSKEDIVSIVKKYEKSLDIKYVRQKDYGYQLCAVRNLGLRTAKYDFVSILDCDMAPNTLWVHSLLSLLKDNDDVALIGPRKYVDTSKHSANDFLANKYLIEQLPEVVTNNNVAGRVENTKSVDWRLSEFQNTDNLRLCDTPFRFFSGGNVAFTKKWLDKAGYFDEDFTHWGGEDNEFGYRLYSVGCFFRSVEGAMAYHQEPPGKENETDRAAGKAVTMKLVAEKVPYCYRKLEPIESALIHKVPLVSIYIPAYNCADSIVRCVNSALNQTVVDLEVCICDDGSTDNTMEIIKKNYRGNPRVRVLGKPNSGIGSASNAAIKMAKGFYIGQLDSDDYLEPDAVELCLKEFFKNRKLVCVYTTNRNVKPDGTLIQNGYNWPVFSREQLTTAMILHHFRMFTIRAWNLTNGFDENITNAVDYDMFLKLSEVGEFKHLNKIAYNRVLHGNNTSIKQLALQKQNHFKVVNLSLQRQKIDKIKYIPLDEKNDTCRKYKFDI